MTAIEVGDLLDTPALRKGRGAFFTPVEVTQFLTSWAIRTPEDRVMEPAAGDAAFLVSAVRRLRDLGACRDARPCVDGVEIHAYSASIARQRVFAAGGHANIRECDFFSTMPSSNYDAVVGNPPFIRYQDFTGEARARSREAALKGGVSLTGLASSWAAFTVHSALFLKRGGRLALVLPAELLSVNYAAPVRKFLFDRFRELQLVLFDQQIFSEAETDVVLLLADGYLNGPASHATIRQSKNASTLEFLGNGQNWIPSDPAGKWTSSLAHPDTFKPLNSLLRRGLFVTLDTWGDTTLGIVTGNNRYFTLSPQRAATLGLTSAELLKLSPPGSSHLRGLSLSNSRLIELGEDGCATYLFYPSDPPSPEATAYIDDGSRTGVDAAYKCRVRKNWYRVPLVRVADLLLTCMNADTPRLTSNEAGVRHLNSVHGVYLLPQHKILGQDLVPLASLNSVSLLHAEIVGRAYGGGILKLEPKEADKWILPSPKLITDKADKLRKIKPVVARFLSKDRLLDAVASVDQILFDNCNAVSGEQIDRVKQARTDFATRRNLRGASGR